MIIYKAYYHHKHEGSCISWHTRRRDAERWHRESIREDGNYGADGVERIVFPAKKSDVIRWLNFHLDRDNV